MGKRSDVVIVGAGPGGLMAGLEAAKAGLAVTIIERKEQIGYPLNCAEAITAPSLETVIDPKPDWIKSRIEYVRLVSPFGHSFVLYHARAGYILDRPKMEQDLAMDFTLAGGTLIIDCRAEQICRKDERFESLVVVKADGSRRSIGADLFIAADGVEGTISRQAGIDNRLELDCTEALFQYRLSGVSIDDDLLEIRLGSRVAPGSYLWIFPRGREEATVGVGAGVSTGYSPRDLLDRFVSDRFPQAKVVTSSCGTSPRYQGPSKLAEKNLLVVGDAARILDSVSGAGIANAMLSGQLAGRAAVAWCRDSGRKLSDLYRIYPREFLMLKHRELDRYRQIKAFINKLSDEELDEIVKGLDDYFRIKSVDAVNPISVFLGMIKQRPRLLRLAGHLF